MVARNQAAGRLRFTTDLAGSVRESQVIFIAVGTPPGEDGSADLQHVIAVAEGIGRAMDGPRIIVTKSTVPVGTARLVRAAVARFSAHEVHVCSNPEFLKEGAAIDDFMKPDRVVVGVDNDHAREVMTELYAPFVRTGNPDPVHGHRVRRSHEVRCERHAGGTHLVHEPGRRILRAGRRGCERGAARHRIGPANRCRLPVPWPRVRRFLFPEGRAGAHSLGAAIRPGARPPRGGRGSQPPPEAGAVRQAATCARWQPPGANRRRVGPRVQGGDGRHA